MREFFQSGRFKILICVLALVFGVMIYAALDAGAATLPERILQAVSRPFSTAATAVSDWVEVSLDRLVNADTYKRENEVLRSQLSEMYGDIMDKDKLAHENDQLRKMLGIAEEKIGYRWAPPCRVIARKAEDMFGGFTVDFGSDAGIAAGNPVFTEIGLVGQVSQAAPGYAVITTVISTETKIGVITARGRVTGIIENDVQYSKDGKCLMSFIKEGSDIAPGDMVLTSEESVYPRDLVIGVVEHVFTDDNGLSLHAVINPAVDIFNVTDVFIIIGEEDEIIDN